MSNDRKQRLLNGFATDDSPAVQTDVDVPQAQPVIVPPVATQATGSNSIVPESEPRPVPLKDATSSPTPIGAAAPDLTGKTVYVVDAHSLIYQVFHAMPEMTSPAGLPVGAVHGFTRDVLDLLTKRKPDYFFCAFDAPGDTFRHQLFDAYKLQRPEMPVDLRLQIGSIRRMLAALRVTVLELPGFEADDLLATVAAQTEGAGGSCFLVSGDKDCRQLLSDSVKIYNIRKDEFYDGASLLRDWGVRADQVVDYQALVGDSVDNVPGVPLIGPKLARELLEKYGTLDRVIECAAEVSGQKRRENLINGRDQALLSRELVRLKTDVPIALDWDAARVGSPNRDEVAALCQEFGFRRLAEQLGQLTPAPQAPLIRTQYQMAKTEDDFAAVRLSLKDAKRVAIYVITPTSRPRWSEPHGMAMSAEVGTSWYLPLADDEIARSRTLDFVREVLTNPPFEIVGHNLKRDQIALRDLGIELPGMAFDTMVADYLLSPGERGHEILDVAARHCPGGIEGLQVADAEVPVQEAREAGRNVDLILRFCDCLAQQLEASQLGTLFRELEMPLVKVLAQIEFTGIRIDCEHLARLGSELGSQLRQLQRKIYELAHCEFNIDSPSQLAKVLFDDLGLPAIKRTKTGRSTDAEVLEQLAETHELPAAIIEYRQLAKLKNTYIDTLPGTVNPRTGRVHTSLKQDVAATGRLSSMDPNLQNIPIRSELGNAIRAAFVPAEPGWRLLTADYSQIELRVLAHFSSDPALVDAFKREEDIHRRVAAEVYGVAPQNVSKEMRRHAKAINFGVLYGQSPFGLAKSLGISKEEAGKFIDAYFARYRDVDRFMTKVLEESWRNEYVSTILGRRRAIQGVRSTSQRGDSRQRNLPERIAINTVIQGSAADLIKLAMIGIHERLSREKFQARMLLQIHDELVFEVPPQEITPLAEMVVHEMTRVGGLSVPLQVDVKQGNNWAECELIAS